MPFGYFGITLIEARVCFRLCKDRYCFIRVYLESLLLNELMTVTYSYIYSVVIFSGSLIWPHRSSDSYVMQILKSDRDLYFHCILDFTQENEFQNHQNLIVSNPIKKTQYVKGGRFSSGELIFNVSTKVKSISSFMKCLLGYLLNLTPYFFLEYFYVNKLIQGLRMHVYCFNLFRWFFPAACLFLHFIPDVIMRHARHCILLSQKVDFVAHALYIV